MSEAEGGERVVAGGGREWVVVVRGRGEWGGSGGVVEGGMGWDSRWGRAVGSEGAGGGRRGHYSWGWVLVGWTVRWGWGRGRVRTEVRVGV